MLLRLALTLLIAAATLAAPNSARANFRIKNHSNETITVHVLTTEIFRDAHVNQFSAVTLRPGGTHDFITNDLVRGRTLCLFIGSQTHGKWFFDANRQMRFQNNDHSGHVVNAPYWPNPFKKAGNRYVSGAAAQANFDPIMSLLPGSRTTAALRIVPRTSRCKTCEITYQGWGQPLGVRSY